MFYVLECIIQLIHYDDIAQAIALLIVINKKMLTIITAGGELSIAWYGII